MSSPVKIYDAQKRKKERPTFSLSRNSFAPTAKTKERGLIQAFVEDDNAWGLGGVSGHAGLFGTLEDVTKLAESLLKGHQGKNQPYAQAKTIKLFTKRAVKPKQGDWSLGYMMPSKPASSAGQLANPKAFGHTGFTGTSIWIDPVSKTSVVILTNRVHPKREDMRFAKLRGLLHDCIWSEL